MRLAGRHRNTRFLEHLHGLLVHANHRSSLVVGLGVRFQHFFHAGHKLGIALRRNYPVLDFALRHAVFLSVRRTVSWLTDSTISSSTAFSANNRNDQLAK